MRPKGKSADISVYHVSSYIKLLPGLAISVSLSCVYALMSTVLRQCYCAAADSAATSIGSYRLRLWYSQSSQAAATAVGATAAAVTAACVMSTCLISRSCCRTLRAALLLQCSDRCKTNTLRNIYCSVRVIAGQASCKAATLRQVSYGLST
jgi:hypothetical protein